MVLQEQNKQLIDSFYVALETEQYEMVKEIFAPDGRQLNPYAPAGFPKSFDGSEGIYQQLITLPEKFISSRFDRQIVATEDPDIFLVLFNGTIELRAGGIYKNDYVGIFKLQDGKVIEYTEYFDPVRMARAFGIKPD